jgi:hypothetical protein
MIGLIGLFLPLFLGLALAALIGRRVERAMRQGVQSKKRLWPVVTRELALAAAVLLGVSVLLALMFAGLTDTLDGHASWPDIVDYALFQFVLMAVFVVPGLLLGLLLGRQKKFEGTQ